MKKFLIISILLLLISASSFSEDSQKSVTIIRVYADSLGESHFEDISWEMVEADFAPPAPPLLTSKFIDSSAFGIHLR